MRDRSASVAPDVTRPRAALDAASDGATRPSPLYRAQTLARPRQPELADTVMRELRPELAPTVQRARLGAATRSRALEPVTPQRAAAPPSQPAIETRRVAAPGQDARDFLAGVRGASRRLRAVAGCGCALLLGAVTWAVAAPGGVTPATRSALHARNHAAIGTQPPGAPAPQPGAAVVAASAVSATAARGSHPRVVSAREAAALLAEGRYREAVDAYRGLAAARPGQPVYAQIARVLERRLAQRCARGKGAGEPACNAP